MALAFLVAVVASSALPMTIYAQAAGGPSSLETMFTKVQTFFTGTIARVAGIISLVIGGLTLAYGEHGSKSKIGFTCIGVATAVGAVNIYTWLTT